MNNQPTHRPGRVIGQYGDPEEGPLLIAVAGLHGNEKAGIMAAQRVLARLETRAPKMQGRLLVVAGNLQALERNERFIAQDLNRLWSPASITRVRTSAPDNDSVEEAELRDLLRVFDEALDEKEKVILVDLHSTSAHASPFCIISDTLQNRKIAFALGIPVILGLEEAISGTIQEFFGERGFITLAVEGGQHEAPFTVDRTESALWVCLHAAGLLAAGDIPDLGMHRGRLRDVCDGLPRVVEVFYRHGIELGDEFRMHNGFRNFSPVNRGERVAHDRKGDIASPEDGLLILPSYQGKGDDGFFVGRHVRYFWLTLSAGLRRLGVDRMLHLFPGVHRDPADPRVLYADPYVARWLTAQVFHLAGYRKCPPDGNMMMFRRRVEG